MELLEAANLDELFYLNPFLSEMYSNCTTSTTSSHGSGGGDHRLMGSTSMINSWNGQETVIAAVEAPQLISFENERLISSFSPTSYEDDSYNLTPQIISFSASSSLEDDFGKRDRVALTATRTPSQAQDHLISERKRRQNLRQLFIDLSKVVPGLRKLDKATLLEDAIKHLKWLQERVIALEKEEVMSSMRASKEDNYMNVSKPPSNNSYKYDCCELGPVKMSVRSREMDVLIKIECCKKEMGLVSRIPCEMEKIRLSVKDIRIMPFGQATLHVTILAQMKSDFVGTVKRIIDHLQALLGP